MKVNIPSRADAPSTNLFVQVIKQDESPGWSRDVIFLIHGGPGGNHTLYSDIVPELLPLADLVLIDLRGCGLSDPAEVQDCTLEQHIKDLDALREALNIKKPIVHGCSYGAIVALGYAIEFPDNLSKLMLISGATSGDFVETARANLKKIGTPEQIKIAERLWNGSFKNLDELSEYYAALAPLYMHSTQKSPTTKSNIPYNIELVNYAFTGFLKEFNFANRLDEVCVPTLIISGQNDWISDPEQSYQLNRGIKNSVLNLLENCGHFPWRDQKHDYLQIIEKFMK